MTNIIKHALFNKASSSSGASAIPDSTGSIVGNVDYPIDITGKTVYNVLVLDAAGNKMEIDWKITGTNLVISSLIDIPNAIIRIITK